MMKILLENWQKYILKEAEEEELYDFGAYKDPEGTYRPTIGYKATRKPEYVKLAKEIFSKTKERWIIIPLWDSWRPAEEIIKSSNFKKWLKSKNYPKNSKILVVGSIDPSGNLFETPDWVIHDVIGHTILEKFYSSNLGRKYTNKQMLNMIPLIERIHNVLPKNMFPVQSYNANDMINDVFTSIILEYLKFEDAISFAETPEEKKFIQDIFDFSTKWANSIPYDKPVVVHSW